MKNRKEQIERLRLIKSIIKSKIDLQIKDQIMNYTFQDDNKTNSEKPKIKRFPGRI